MRRATKLRPFRQGGFDSLCGIYSIINVLRLILQGDCRVKGKDYATIFEKLIYRAHELSPKSAPSVEGIDTPRLAELLADTIDYCDDEFDIEIELTRPLLRAPRGRVSQAVNHLRNELATPSTAILIGFGGLDHWTVVKAITDFHLILHDSSGRRYLRKHRCRMSYEAPRRTKPLVIMRGATFALRKI